MGQPPSAYLDAQSPVERHDALPDTLLLRLVGLDWKHPPSTTAKKKKEKKKKAQHSLTLPQAHHTQSQRAPLHTEDDCEKPTQEQLRGEERRIQPGGCQEKPEDQQQQRQQQ